MLWDRVGTAIRGAHQTDPETPLASSFRPEVIRVALADFDFAKRRDPASVVDFVVGGLRDWTVPTTHRRYYGLYNPSTGSLGVAADALVAGFNPQLAAWTHAAFANEIERHLVRALGSKFGFADAGGTFCSAGAEANLTSLLCALVARFPDFAEHGLRSLGGQPVFYVSEQAHHSFVKAARFSGLGTSAVRQVAVDDRFAMDAGRLRTMIAEDREAGLIPFMIAATAGTTSGGVIDPLGELASIAEGEGLWFHTDAAWGGAAALSPSLAPALEGIERSDSITFDAHKWLSVPMGAGIVLTRDAESLRRACRIETEYMPRDGRGLDIVDPYASSMQWSRRFTGLKLFMTLAHLGWDGYAQVIDRQAAIGDYLKRRLKEESWLVLNSTPFPIACISRPGYDEGRLLAIVNRVVESGEAWISFTRLRTDTPVVRICITHYGSDERDIDALLSSLGRAAAKAG